MALAQGSISLVSVGSSTANLLAPAATGGSGSVTYQYYRSITSGFTPSSLNAIAGATSLALADSGLTPGTVYYYEIVATDAAAAVASSTQLQVSTTAASPNPNQFAPQPFLGMLDLQFNGDTISAQFDPSGSGSLVGGQAVKWSVGSATIPSIAPLVVPSLLASDAIVGYVNYDIKSASFSPGNRLELSLAGNVMYLYAAQAISRGQFVTSLPAAVAGGCNGGVIPVTGSSGLPIVGFSLDTVAIGQLCRIMLKTPAASYQID